MSMAQINGPLTQTTRTQLPKGTVVITDGIKQEARIYEAGVKGNAGPISLPMSQHYNALVFSGPSPATDLNTGVMSLVGDDNKVQWYDQSTGAAVTVNDTKGSASATGPVFRPE